MDIEIRVTNTLEAQNNLTAEIVVYGPDGLVHGKYLLTLLRPPTKLDIVVPFGGRFEMRKFVPRTVYDPVKMMAVPEKGT
jgi:hypothetical protein